MGVGSRRDERTGTTMRITRWQAGIVTVAVGAALSGCGGGPETLAMGQVQVLSLAVDATSVYWASPDMGLLVKLTPK